MLTRQSVFAELIVSAAANDLTETIRNGVPLDGPPLDVIVDEHRVLIVRRPFSGVRTPSDPKQLGTALLHATSEADRLGVGTGIHASQIVLDRGRPRLATLHSLFESNPGHEALTRQLRALDAAYFGPLCDEFNSPVEMARSLARRHERDAWPEQPPLVGLTKLVNRLEGSLTSGGTSSLVLSGPAGVGKTRTLNELMRRLSRRGLRVALVRADARSDGPVLLWAAASTVDPDDAGVLQQVRARLSAMPGMSPEWLEDPSAHGGPEPQDLDVDGRHRRYCQVLAESVLELLTTRGDGVLFIDDADQLGPGSQAVLNEVRALDAHEQRLAIVATARNADAVDATIAMSHMAIPGLNAEAVEDLLDATIPDASTLPHLGGRLLAQVGPRPLHLWTWIRHLAESGELWSPELASTSALVDLQTRRVAAQTPAAQSVLRVLSLRPEPWDAADIATVLGHTTPVVMQAISSLAQAGLATSYGSRTARVAHATTAENVRLHLDDAVARDLHRNIARWLARNRGNLPEVVRHQEMATTTGADPALAEQHLDAAREAMSTYDLDRARWHLDHAIDRAPGPAQATRARRHLAHVDLLTGRLTEAQAAYFELLDDAPPDQALHLAREAMYGFYRRNASESALQIGRHALRRAGEWVPDRNVLLGVALVFTLLGRRREIAAVRDALAAIYTLMVPLAAASHPGLLTLCVARSRRLAWDLPTEWGASANALSAMLLAILGFRRRANAALESADAAATQCGSPRALGEVEHIRGQIQLAYGEYELGQSALARAAASFETAGDMTLGTISLFLKADYGLHREPDHVLRQWLILADDAARRQGNQLVRPSIAALELLLDARDGQALGGRESSVLRRLDALDPGALDAVLGRSYLSLALLESGDLHGARATIETAAEAVGPDRFALEIMQVMYFAQGRIALAAQTTDTQLANSCIATLNRLGKQSSRARAAAELLGAELALTLGDAAGAQAALEKLIAMEGYGETRLWARAEHALGTLLGRPDLQERAEERRVALRTVDSDTRMGAADSLHPIIASLRELMDPRAITIDVSELKQLHESAASVVLLAAMAVRDQTTGEMSVRIATRTTGDVRHTTVDISAGGARQTSPLGLSGVRQAVDALGGELSVGPSIGTRRVVLNLPPTRGGRDLPQIAVVHSNPLIKEALERAVRGLGYAISASAPALTFTEPGRNVGGMVIVVVPRTAAKQPGTLAFPFSLGELALILQQQVGPPVSAERVEAG